MKRKSIVLVLATLLALVVALPAIPAAPAAAAGHESTVYLALGDSLAQGWGNNSLEKHPYVTRFYDYLQSGHHSSVGQLINLGFGGETSLSFITGVLPPNPPRTPQLDQALAIIANPATDVSVVTLDIGGNDLLDLLKPGGACYPDPTTHDCHDAVVIAMGAFVNNYGYIMGTLTAALQSDPGDESFIVMTYYNPWSGTGSPIEAVIDGVLLGNDMTINCANQAGWGMNDIIACVPHSLPYGAMVSVADVYPRFVGKGMDLTYVAYNNIHPNNAGYAQIANVFRETYLSR